jgi:mRNA interferase MazF
MERSTELRTFVPGDVVYTNFPQSNSEVKFRPAIILKIIPPFQDILVCGVTTRVRHYIPELDEVITSRDEDFVSSGLQKDSMIRLGNLITFSEKHIQGPIGQISQTRLACLQRRLADFLIH